MTHVEEVYSADLLPVCLQLGKVLRAKKILNDKAQPAPTCEVFSSSEQLVWGEIPGLVESLEQDCLPQAYAQVMSQHLGANHVDGGVRLTLNLIMFLIVIFL
jgi:inositol-pentakisphosphate 2-kinase